MNTDENNLSSTFTPAAFLFPLPSTAVKLMEGYTATSYRTYPKGYNPLLSALPSSFDYIYEGIAPEFTSHTLMPEKGWETEIPPSPPKGLHT